MASDSQVIYLGNIPYHWNDENLKSVLKGSGRITDFRIRYEAPGRNKGFCFVEYVNSEEAINAIERLKQVQVNGRKRFRVELSKEGLRAVHQTGGSKSLLNFTRDAFPPEVVLPKEMLAPDELGRYKEAAEGTNEVQQPMPDRLLNAPDNLPELNADLFQADNKVAENLQKIPPAKIIQLIATLKNLLIQKDLTNAANILKYNNQITVAIAQALLLMGFVNNDVITQAASNVASGNGLTTENMQTTRQNNSYSNNTNYGGNQGNNYGNGSFNSNSNNNNNNTNHVNNGYGDNGNNFNQYNRGTLQPPPPSIPAIPNAASIPPPPRNPSIPPEWQLLPPQTIAKLLQIPDQNQAKVIAQVLVLTPDQLYQLPGEQKAAVDQIRLQYL